jgi:hypothetical protein
VKCLSYCQSISPFEGPSYTDIKQIFDEQRLTITD